jgi:signal transduction histidine kinase
VESERVTTGWAEHLAPADDPGVVFLDDSGAVVLSDQRAESVLGRDAARLRADWPALKRRLDAAAGDDLWRRENAAVAAEVPVGGDARRVDVRVRRLAGRGHLLLVREADAAEAAAFDRRLAGQMHTLSRLYRAMAHDLRGPLNTMVVNLELLADAVSPGATGPQVERLPRYVRVMKDETYRLTRYLNAFLSGVAPPVYGERDVDLVREMPEVAEFVSAQARRREVEVDVDLPDGPLRVHGSAEDLRQALLSILTHALDQVPQGDTLVIEGERDGDRVLLTVESEEGFDVAAARRALEDGIADRSDGAALSLAVARATARRLGGDLRIVEGSDEGARFELELPAAPTEES